MTPNTKELIGVIALLAENKPFHVTFKKSAQGAGIVGTSAFIGGLLGGPIGIGLGAVIGGVGSAILFYGHFKSLARVLREDLSEDEREQLKQQIIKAVEDNGVEDLLTLIPLLLRNHEIQEVVLAAAISFVKNQKGMSIVD